MLGVACFECHRVRCDYTPPKGRIARPIPVLREAVRVQSDVVVRQVPGYTELGSTPRIVHMKHMSRCCGSYANPACA